MNIENKANSSLVFYDSEFLRAEKILYRCLGPNVAAEVFLSRRTASARGSHSPTGSLALRRANGRDGNTGVAQATPDIKSAFPCCAIA